MEFLAVFMVRRWFDNQMVELTALVATRATSSFCFSNEELVNAAYSIEMRSTQSVCVAVEAVAYCFNVAVSVTSCQSE